MKKPFGGNYKTYDASKGYGSKQQWQQAFNERMGFDEASKIIKEQRETPESILGVSKSATVDEIKSAFRKLIKTWHPDNNPDRLAEAEQQSKTIIAAYTILMKKHSSL